MYRKWLKLDIFSNRFTFFIRMIEFVFAAILVLCALISAINLIVSAMAELNRVDILFDYNYFQNLLSFILLLIIALELAVMLIRQNPNIVLEVMIYAIARKLLILNSTAVEILIGVIAMTVLFALRIYLARRKPLPETDHLKEAAAAPKTDEDDLT